MTFLEMLRARQEHYEMLYRQKRICRETFKACLESLGYTKTLAENEIRFVEGIE